MAHIRFSLAVLLAALLVAPVGAGPGLFGSKPKPDAARVRVLIETLKNDPDEKKRKAAAIELGWADGRVTPDVAPALAAALQKDASAAVRAEVAESLGQINQMIPVAGMALEAAVAGDSSAAVRMAAKKTLWEYHLRGYHSPRAADGHLTQTVEPPIAKPGGPQTIALFTPAPPMPSYIAPLPTEPPTSASQLPQVAPPNGPRVVWPLSSELLPGPQTTIRTLTAATPPPILNVTSEPPIAKRAPVSIPPLPVPTAPLPTPTSAAEPPPTQDELPVPDYVPTLPPFVPDLPSVVVPPDATALDPVPVPTPPKIPATLPPLPR